MMYEFIWFRMFLLINVLARFLSGTDAESIPIYVCPGNSVPVFHNITFDSCNDNIYLYIKNGGTRLIAMWSLQNCTLYSVVAKDNLDLDEYGTIWISNVHRWDQAKYVVISDTSSFMHDVEIFVMEAPAKNCIPSIIKLTNSLFATMEGKCGRPVPSLYWKNTSDFSKRSNPLLNLTPGKEAGRYYACIEGQALTCVENLMPQDYCSYYVIAGDNRPGVTSSSVIWKMKTLVYIPVCIHLANLISFHIA